MEPYLYEGNRVVTFNWTTLKAGDVIVFAFPSRHPESRLAGRRIYKEILHFAWGDKKWNGRSAYWIKRIKKVSSREYYVEGYNKKVSSKVGPITKNAIVGKVVLKY